ncbi:11771_t:CDS:2 [Entrophospora sp. SA101]|nr:11771_t:CDS:2 [Entrophospora sp. SA101]
MPKPKRKIRIAEENEESSTVLETFENAEENTNVEEESADDEIEESHIFFEDTEDVGNEYGEEFANVEDEGFLWFDSEINKNADTIYDILSKNIENLISSNRPSKYTGNSRMTIYRRKNKAKTDAQRNGQTLDQFFLPKNDDDDE